jgi:hypothetical protein
MAASTPVPSAVNATPRSLPIWLTAGAQGASVPKIRSVSASLANDHQLRSVGRSVSILRKSDGTTLSGAGSGARLKGLRSPTGLLWCGRDDAALMVNKPISIVFVPA